MKISVTESLYQGLSKIILSHKEKKRIVFYKSLWDSNWSEKKNNLAGFY